MAAWVVPAAIAAAGFILDAVGRRSQRKFNEKYTAQQNRYNEPKSQMARFQSAGLNPNLVYTQGTPGQQSAPVSAPESGDIGSKAVASYNASSVSQSQVVARTAQTERTKVLTQIDRVKKAVLERNPLLNDAALNSIISALESTAKEKAAQAGIAQTQSQWFQGEEKWDRNGNLVEGPAGARKMDAELKLLEQKFALGSADQSIKAQVLDSKEFQNSILEIQAKFMKDGEITPQHIYQFIMLLLGKLISK